LPGQVARGQLLFLASAPDELSKSWAIEFLRMGMAGWPPFAMVGRCFHVITIVIT
jgi:hypothetical protein